MKDIHILIVEDETIIALDMKQCLESFGYIVDEIADNTEDSMMFVKKYSPDIVLMDINLKGKNTGISIVNEIQKKHKIPVVYISSYSDEETLTEVGDTKPYGYIVKPVDEHNLNATIQIALARFKEDHHKQSDDNILSFCNNYTYDLQKKSFFHNNTEISLTKKERELVSILAKNIDTTVSSEQLIYQIWEDKSISTSTLRSLVRRVRDKLKDNLIESSNNIGYRLKSRLDDEKR